MAMERVLSLIVAAENRIDALKRRGESFFEKEERLHIIPYRGFGNADDIRVSGRVLEDKGIAPATEHDSLWDHLVAMYKRLETDEAPGVRVRVAAGAHETTVVTDEEGFFSARLPLKAPPPANGWIPIVCTLLDSAPAQPTQFHGEALIPLADAQFGVISDIDDTIIVSHATSFLQMARLTLLNNARQRVPFTGAASFYRALHAGAKGRAANPIFYLSSSPHNLYDLLTDFIEIHGFPAGPLLLRDYGLDRSLWRTFEHGGHKSAHIDELLAFYPGLPFILIGDSGQQDPEIYAQAVERWPGRICAVYIRSVTGAARNAQVQAIAKGVQARGVEMLLVADTAAAAQHAQRAGWISQSAANQAR